MWICCDTKGGVHFLFLTSENFPRQIAKLLLDYMYTGYMGVNLSMIGPLLVASQQLCMDDVVQCCCLHLLNSLGISTWAQVQSYVLQTPKFMLI